MLRSSSCPHCGYFFEKAVNDERQFIYIGRPFVVCPNCRRVVLIPKTKEVIQMSKSDTIKFIISHTIGSFVLMVFLLLIIYYIAITCSPYNVINTIKNNNALVIASCFIISLIISFLYSIHRYKKDYKKSINRLKNINYLNELLNLKLVTKEQVREFVEAHKDNFPNNDNNDKGSNYASNDKANIKESASKELKNEKNNASDLNIDNSNQAIDNKSNDVISANITSEQIESTIDTMSIQSETESNKDHKVSQPLKTNDPNQKKQKTLITILASVIAILAFCSSIYIYNQKIEIDNLRNDAEHQKEAKELQTEIAQDFKDKYYNAVTYIKNLKYYDDFYANKRVLVNPKNELVEIHFDYNYSYTVYFSTWLDDVEWEDSSTYNTNYLRIKDYKKGLWKIEITNNINDEKFDILVIGY